MLEMFELIHRAVYVRSVVIHARRYAQPASPDRKVDARSSQPHLYLGDVGSGLGKGQDARSLCGAFHRTPDLSSHRLEPFGRMIVQIPDVRLDTTRTQGEVQLRCRLQAVEARKIL